MQHRRVTVSGASIHAVTAGPADAPALVLLHGWPESWATWRELIPLAAPDHRVVAIDLPGIGGSGVDGSGIGGSGIDGSGIDGSGIDGSGIDGSGIDGSGIDGSGIDGSGIDGITGSKAGIASLVHGLIGALGLTDVTLVGHDIGGMVAYAALRAFPGLSRVVIMDVPIPGVDPWDEFVRAPFLWHFALHAVPDLPELLVTGRQPAYFDYFYDLLSAGGSVPAREVREEQAGAYASPAALTAGFDWYRAFGQDVTDNQRAAAGPPVPTPLLYLRGGAERGGPIDGYVAGLRRAGVTDVRPGVIEGAGHFPHQEAPSATWLAIAAFITATGAAAPGRAE